MKDNLELRQKYSKKLYNMTTYVTYHQYKASLKRLNTFLAIILGVALLAILVQGAYSFLLANLVFISLVIYTIFYFGVNKKARWLELDSKKVMVSLAVNGYTPQTWRVYDGIYKEDSENENEFSLEIAFTKERTYIENLYCLLNKKGKTLLPHKDELIMLSNYITKLEENSYDYKFVVYATVSPELYKELREYGFTLIPLERKYITKPSKLDYSVAVGSIRKGYGHYPKFKCYKIEYATE